MVAKQFFVVKLTFFNLPFRQTLSSRVKQVHICSNKKKSIMFLGTKWKHFMLFCQNGIEHFFKQRSFFYLVRTFCCFLNPHTMIFLFLFFFAPKVRKKLRYFKVFSAFIFQISFLEVWTNYVDKLCCIFDIPHPLCRHFN